MSNLKYMGKPSLILAALAADALPGVRFVQIQYSEETNSEIECNLLTTDDNRVVVVKAPQSALAATALGTEVRALRLLKNVTLPFRVNTYLGETSPSAIFKALVFEYIPGSNLDLRSNKAEDLVVSNLGQALARIHSIPLSLVADAGLPDYQPQEIARIKLQEFDRIADTGKVPAVMLERWQNALLDVNLFRFQPTVIHGDLKIDKILTDGQQILGINSWNQLAIDDPAKDLAFLFVENPALASAVILAYESTIRADRNIKQRALLYSEMSLGLMLLDSLAFNDERGVTEVVDYLNGLAEDLKEGLLASLSPTEFASSQPEVVTPISQAASFTGPITAITENIEVIDLSDNEDR